MLDPSDYRPNQETLWLTFLAPHHIKLRDIAPVEEGMGQFWRKRFNVSSWPGLVLAGVTESDDGFFCSLWLQSVGDRAALPSVSDFVAALDRVTTALQTGTLPAADDCCDLEARPMLVSPTAPRPKPSVWDWPDYGLRSFLHEMKKLRVGIGTSISVIRPSVGRDQVSAPLEHVVVRGGEWRALCQTYEALTRPSQPSR